jgi:hypothetical protein
MVVLCEKAKSLWHKGTLGVQFHAFLITAVDVSVQINDADALPPGNRPNRKEDEWG